MKIEIIGAPLDLGAGMAGADEGPKGMRDAGLVAMLSRLGHPLVDRGDIPVASRETAPMGDPKLRFLDPILELTRSLCAATKQAVAAGSVPLVIGGDHSLALGSIRGAALAKHECDERLGVIWVDAHGDFNTVETSPSGNIHGMPLAAVAGLGDDRLTGLGGPRRIILPENIALIGVRELDDGERDLLAREKVAVFTADDVRRDGIDAVVDRAIAITTRGTSGIYLSFDLDGVDPSVAPGVSTAVPGGLTREDSVALAWAIGATGLLAGMDLVELNPLTDKNAITAALALDIIKGAMRFGTPSFSERPPPRSVR